MSGALDGEGYSTTDYRAFRRARQDTVRLLRHPFT